MTFEPLGIGTSVLKIIIAVMLLALPIVAYLSWVFDIGPEDEVKRISSAKPWLEASITALALAVLGIGCWIVLTPSGSTEPNRTASDLSAADNKMRSIAVLPLENLSGDPEQEFFSDGTTDMLIQELRKIRSLRIISRQSVVQYKNSAETAGNIAVALNVDGLLTGTVIQTPELVRFTLQLYDADSDRIIWAESLDRSPTHILTLQSDIARAVSRQINIELTGSELAALSVSREVDPESHKAYLRGRFLLTQNNYDAAGKAFHLAAKLDPSNPDALAELARLASIEVWIGAPVQEQLPVMRRYIDDALALDPDHVAAQASDASILWFVDRKYQEAIDQFAKLLNTEPNNQNVLISYSFLLESFGRLDLALQLINRIIDLDPIDADRVRARGEIYHLMGNYEKALASYEEAEQLGTQSPLYLARLALDKGDKQNLAIQLQRDWPRAFSVWHPVLEAEFAKLSGDTQRMRSIIQLHEKEDGAEHWRLQHNYPLMLGEIERAIELYSRALDNREPMALIRALGSIGQRKRYPEFYSHLKYEEMLRTNGLDDESLSKLRIPPFPF